MLCACLLCRVDVSFSLRRLPEDQQGLQPISEASSDEIREVVGDAPAYRVNQVLHAVYRTPATAFDQIQTLPVTMRELLGHSFRYEALKTIRSEMSQDGTEKTLFCASDGAVVETVQMLTERSGATTICLSSQSGCGMGCRFCATGDIGLTRNLTPGEIVDQFLYFRRRSEVSRVPDRAVFMGMGEPLANLNALEPAVRALVDPGRVGLGARRVTISTVGLPDGIDALVDWNLPVGLAISLHAPVDDLRATLVPIARRFPLDELMAVSSRFQRRARRRVTYEYTMLDGVNDSLGQAVDLALLLRGQRCHVNLIPFNPYPGALYRTTPRPRLQAFRDALHSRGVGATIRRTRGRDISGACGQLHAGVLTLAQSDGPRTPDGMSETKTNSSSTLNEMQRQARSGEDVG